MKVVWDYSQKWRFSFNLDKSAIVVFDGKAKNRSKNSNCNRHWKFGEGFIEEVEVYKYLGIEFDRKFTFSDFKGRILDRARKNRGILGSLSSSKGSLSVRANIKSMGRKYGADVGIWEDAELILRESGRRILKCSSKTSNAAVRGDLGWWKLSTRRHFLALKYWIRVLLMSDSRLVKRVYRQSKKEYIFRNRGNWAKYIHKLVQKYAVEELWSDESKVWEAR